MSTRDALNASDVRAAELAELCELYVVLSHPTRVRIMLAVEHAGETSAKRVADELHEPLGNVSYHLKFLRDHGCVRGTRDVPRRGAVEHYVELTHRALAAVALVALDLHAHRVAPDGAHA
jgi:DNA-binding transcriptional ArsR family regulator